MSPGAQRSPTIFVNEYGSPLEFYVPRLGNREDVIWMVVMHGGRAPHHYSKNSLYVLTKEMVNNLQPTRFRGTALSFSYIPDCIRKGQLLPMDKYIVQVPIVKRVPKRITHTHYQDGVLLLTLNSILDESPDLSPMDPALWPIIRKVQRIRPCSYHRNWAH